MRLADENLATKADTKFLASRWPLAMIRQPNKNPGYIDQQTLNALQS